MNLNRMKMNNFFDIRYTIQNQHVSITEHYF